jgi:hypothetical protein
MQSKDQKEKSLKKKNFLLAFLLTQLFSMVSKKWLKATESPLFCAFSYGGKSEKNT